jgi:hypothetical protein
MMQPQSEVIRRGQGDSVCVIYRQARCERSRGYQEDTVQLAVWLQYLAELGILLTGEVTLHLLPDAIQYTAPRHVHVPGQTHLVKT